MNFQCHNFQSKAFQPLLTDLFYWLSRNWVKLVVVLGMAAWLAVVSFPDNKVRIVFCSAGQGDETLIQRGFTQILIDGSRPGKALDCLRKHVPFFDRQIEMVIVSHPQLDHFGGLTDVFKRYKVRSFVYNGLRGDSHEWEVLSEAVLAEGAEIEVVAAGDEIRVGGMKLKVLWPKTTIDDRRLKVGVEDRKSKVDSQGNLSSIIHLPLPSSTVHHPSSNILGISSPDSLNSSAVVMDFNYGDFDALFTGDIGEEEENLIRPGLEQSKAGPFDILKVAHHGSKYSSSLDFLKAVKPALAVIEVGKNSYGHPTAETLTRLKEVGAQVLRTDQDGDVVVTTNGRGWQVKQDR